MIVIGCDPGLTGAMCFLGNGWQEIVDIPTCLNGQASGSMKLWVDIHKLKRSISEIGCQRHFAEEQVFAVIERPVATNTRPGGRVAPAQTIAAQFDTFGSIRALMLCRGYRTSYPTPQAWKKLYGIAGPDKERAREIASNLYPALAPMLNRVKDHNRAEAVLIAHYGLKEMA